MRTIDVVNNSTVVTNADVESAMAALGNPDLPGLRTSRLPLGQPAVRGQVQGGTRIDP